MLNFVEPVEIVPLMPVNVGNQWDTLKVTIILFTFQFPTSLMRHQLFQQFMYDDNSVVAFLVLEIIEEYK